jgi:hypothetical protein
VCPQNESQAEVTCYGTATHFKRTEAGPSGGVKTFVGDYYINVIETEDVSRGDRRPCFALR